MSNTTAHEETVTEKYEYDEAGRVLVKTTTVTRTTTHEDVA